MLITEAAASNGVVPLRRTVRVALDTPADVAASLHATIDQYRVAADHVVDAAWPDDSAADEHVETRRTALHEQTYDAVREATDLPAQLVQSARNRAANALSGVIARWEDGQEAGKPSFTAPTIRYDTRSATIRGDHATLATVDGRVRVDFRLPSDPDGTPHERYLYAEAWTVCGADLVYDDLDDEFWLHVRVEGDEAAVIAATGAASDDRDRGDDDTAPPTGAGHRTVLGVDCGIDNLAVSSTGAFWSGRELAHWRREYEERRAALQSRGTRAAQAAARRVARRWRGYADHLLHRVSRDVVAEAHTHGCTAIAVEDLTGIQSSLPGGQRFQTWAFRRLQSYVAYKAAEVGIETVQVDPARTSQRCSRCGHVAGANRRSQRQFRCSRCGYAVSADYNAAKNIGLRAVDERDNPEPDDERELQSAQTSAAGGAPEGVRLNGGTLTPSGTYVPAARSTGG